MEPTQSPAHGGGGGAGSRGRAGDVEVMMWVWVGTVTPGSICVWDSEPGLEFDPSSGNSESNTTVFATHTLAYP